MGVGLIQLVTRSQVPSFLASLRAAGINAPGVIPPGVRSTYCLGSYADWKNIQIHASIFGYDFCTDSALDAGLWNSADSGVAAVVAGSSLPPAFAADFIEMHPIYRGSPKTPSARRASITGWVVAIVNGPAIVRSLRGLSAQGTSFALYTATGGTETRIMACAAPTSSSVVPWTYVTHFEADGSWVFKAREVPGAGAWAVNTFGAFALLVVGLILVLALATLLGTLSTGRRRALGLLDRETRTLRESEEPFRSLASTAPIGILEISPDAFAVFANARLGEISGRPHESLLGLAWVEAIHPDDRATVLALARRASSDHQGVATNFRVVRLSGEVRHVRLLAAAKGRDPDSDYVISIEDVTDEVRGREALVHQTLHDPLTGLPNRILFLDRLGLELSRGRRDHVSIAVLFLDLDRFKLVNDSFGHHAGDELLKQVADRLSAEVRAGETMARLGGDEFAFIIHDVDGTDVAAATAERLLAVLAKPMTFAGHLMTVTDSIGLVITKDHANAEVVLRDADTAMYTAKDGGHNGFRIFSDDLHELSLSRLTLERELRRALELDEFRLYYQPVVDPANDAPMGVEALVRWEHPDRGMVSPIEFIPIAEETGLIDPIGRWVLETAITQMRAWDDDTLAPTLRVMSVNVSVHQLSDPELAGYVQQLLERGGIEPNRLCIEITESAIMVDNEIARRCLENFHRLGLRVAVDDFGTGYSSLSHLHSLPVTSVKIDATFIQRLGGADDSTPVVAAIVEMSHALGLRVIAEGVSSGPLGDVVASLDCDLAQGFFWSPPLPAAALSAWCRLAPPPASASYESFEVEHALSTAASLS